MLIVENLTFCYHTQLPLIEDLNLRLQAGLHCMVGPNASGKSTVMRILCGVQSGFQGIVRLGDLCPTRNSKAYLTQVSYAPAESSFFPSLTARDLFAFIRHRRNTVDKNQQHVLQECFGINKLLDKPLHQLSTGSLKKVILVAALMTPASLYLFDEPFIGLDASSVAQFRQLLSELRERIVLMIAHERFIQPADAVNMIDFRAINQAE